MQGAERFSRVNLLADPLYGYIEITKPQLPGASCERDLLDSPWLQRMRKIHQLQSTWWVFPTAEHTRFSHLLGSMHLASSFAHQIDSSLRAAFPDAPSPALVEETLRIAGLLHDVGHGPFGHFFDHEYLQQYQMDHEDIGRHMVLNELADLISSQGASPAGPFAPGEHIDPRWVAWIMAPAELEGYTPPGWLAACKPILCGPATIDNLDYVRRDAYMCGVSLGAVDVQRLLHYTFVTNGTTALHNNATGALELFLVARLYMYMQVYLHRTGRRFDLSMHEVFGDTISQLLPGKPTEHMEIYLDLTDWSLLEAVRTWKHEPPGSEKRRLGDAWHRIVSRDLPWTLAHEALVQSGADITHLEQAIRSELPSSLSGLSFVVDVASTSIAPYNPMHEKGMVAIYDPLQDGVVLSRTADLISRLPQYNQMVRIFTKETQHITALSVASRQVLAPVQSSSRGALDPLQGVPLAG